MSRRKIIWLVLFGIGAVLLVTRCNPYWTKTYRYRMTVEIETPEGLRTGSSVYEVGAHKLVALTSEEAERSAWTKGQATMVDLPNGQTLFVLMSGRGANPAIEFTTASMETLDPKYDGDWVESTTRISHSVLGREGELPRESWPLMVRFRDINDPKSVEEVAPEAIGVRRIMLETTSDPMTSGIEKKLPWLGVYARRGNIVSGPTINPSIRQSIRDYDFSSEYE